MISSMTIGEVFAPLIGQLVWAVKGGFGTFITMEFGDSHLTIEEPMVARRSSSERLRRHIARRRPV